MQPAVSRPSSTIVTGVAAVPCGKNFNWPFTVLYFVSISCTDFETKSPPIAGCDINSGETVSSIYIIA